ncbi:hypothetical protein NMY22_g837 [Coprinellus aureogranulatus]|nr:hypothetical protein NMY22_g837 [Coprinellus aureogranulatus]
MHLAGPIRINFWLDDLYLEHERPPCCTLSLVEIPLPGRRQQLLHLRHIDSAPGLKLAEVNLESNDSLLERGRSANALTLGLSRTPGTLSHLRLVSSARNSLICSIGTLNLWHISLPDWIALDHLGLGRLKCPQPLIGPLGNCRRTELADEPSNSEARANEDAAMLLVYLTSLKPDKGSVPPLVEPSELATENPVLTWPHNPMDLDQAVPVVADDFLLNCLRPASNPQPPYSRALCCARLFQSHASLEGFSAESKFELGAYLERLCPNTTPLRCKVGNGNSGTSLIGPPHPLAQPRLTPFAFVLSVFPTHLEHCICLLLSRLCLLALASASSAAFNPHTIVATRQSRFTTKGAEAASYDAQHSEIIRDRSACSLHSSSPLVITLLASPMDTMVSIAPPPTLGRDHRVVDQDSDTQRKAAWLGVPLAHAVHIQQTLHNTPSMLPDNDSNVFQVREAVTNLKILIAILQENKDVGTDLRQLVAECCKFLVILVRHISGQNGEISPSVSLAVEAIGQTVTVILDAYTSRPPEPSFWSKFTPVSTEKNKLSESVSHLRNTLRVTWDGCHSEVSSAADAIATAPAVTMNEQMNAILEGTVRITQEPRYYEGYADTLSLLSGFGDGSSRFHGGIDSYLIHNHHVNRNGAGSATHSRKGPQEPGTSDVRGKTRPPKKNSLPPSPPAYRGRPHNTYFTTPNPSPFLPSSELPASKEAEAR